MINAIIEGMSATVSEPQVSSHTDVKPDVMGFYDAPTGSIQYIVTDPSTRKCAIIDPVLDFDPRFRINANDVRRSTFKVHRSAWAHFGMDSRHASARRSFFCRRLFER